MAISETAGLVRISQDWNGAADVDFGDDHRTGLFLDEVTAKTVNILDGDGNAVSYENLALGVWHPIVVKKLVAAGTTATRVKVRVA